LRRRVAEGILTEGAGGRLIWDLRHLA